MFNISPALSGSIALSVVTAAVGFSHPPTSLAQQPTQSTIALQARTGLNTHIQVSLSRRQATVYQGNVKLQTYPIAIGRPGMETPTGTFSITKMLENPAWENPWTGQLIPSNSKANPLGPYFLGFFNKQGTWYGFHGTNEPNSIGRAMSHGCLRMQNKDVEKLFSQVTFGTTVTITRN